MIVEDARMLVELYLRRIHESTTLARAGKNSEDPYDRVSFEKRAQECFIANKESLESVIARYLESASKEVGLSHTTDVPG